MAGARAAAAVAVVALAVVGGLRGAAADGNYTFTVSITSDLTLSWRLDATNAYFKMSYARANSWYSVGFNAGGVSMAGTDTMVFEPATGTVTPYMVSGRSQSSCAAVGVGSPLSNIVVGPGSTVTLTRTLAAGSYTGAVALPATGTITLVYAMSPGSASLDRHTTAGGGTLDLARGTFSAGASLQAVARAAHAAIMVLVWAVLVPAGVGVARFFRAVNAGAEGDPWWFKWHWRVQTTASVLLAIAAVGGLVATPKELHFTATHHLLGAGVVVAGLLQPIATCCRPPPNPRRTGRVVWEVSHKTLGYVAALVAIPACLTGVPLLLDPAGDTYTAITAAVIALSLTAFAALQLRATIRGYVQRQRDATEAEMVATRAARRVAAAAGAGDKPAAAGTPLTKNPLRSAPL